MEEEYFQDDDVNVNVELPKEIMDKIKEKKCQICSMPEALSLIEGIKGEKKNQNYEEDVAKAAKEYLYTFNKYGVKNGDKPSDIAFRLRKILDYNEKVFSDLELALLIDLAPSNAEEAFALIPSLKHKLKAEQLNEYLYKLNNEIKTNY